MKPNTCNFSCEDVLNAFAVEANHDRSTLERYLRDYPQYAIEIANLSHELSRSAIEPADLSAEDRAAIDEAWMVYSTSFSAATANIFASLSVPQLRELAKQLGVPRQIITAFREQKVIVSTIPRRFLERVASALNSTVEQVVAALTLPLEAGFVRSHKADEKPQAVAPATFERLLIDAQVPEDRRAQLMAEGN